MDAALKEHIQSFYYRPAEKISYSEYINTAHEISQTYFYSLYFLITKSSDIMHFLTGMRWWISLGYRALSKSHAGFLSIIISSTMVGLLVWKYATLAAYAIVLTSCCMAVLWVATSAVKLFVFSRYHIQNLFDARLIEGDFHRHCETIEAQLNSDKDLLHAKLALIDQENNTLEKIQQLESIKSEYVETHYDKLVHKAAPLWTKEWRIKASQQSKNEIDLAIKNMGEKFKAELKKEYVDCDSCNNWPDFFDKYASFGKYCDRANRAQKNEEIIKKFIPEYTIESFKAVFLQKITDWSLHDQETLSALWPVERLKYIEKFEEFFKEEALQHQSNEHNTKIWLEQIKYKCLGWECSFQDCPVDSYWTEEMKQALSSLRVQSASAIQQQYSHVNDNISIERPNSILTSKINIKQGESGATEEIVLNLQACTKENLATKTLKDCEGYLPQIINHDAQKFISIIAEYFHDSNEEKLKWMQSQNTLHVKNNIDYSQLISQWIDLLNNKAMIPIDLQLYVEQYFFNTFFFSKELEGDLIWNDMLKKIAVDVNTLPDRFLKAILRHHNRDERFKRYSNLIKRYEWTLERKVAFLDIYLFEHVAITARAIGLPIDEIQKVVAISQRLKSEYKNARENYFQSIQNILLFLKSIVADSQDWEFRIDGQWHPKKSPKEEDIIRLTEYTFIPMAGALSIPIAAGMAGNKIIEFFQPKHLYRNENWAARYDNILITFTEKFHQSAADWLEENKPIEEIYKEFDGLSQNYVPKMPFIRISQYKLENHGDFRTLWESFKCAYAQIKLCQNTLGKDYSQTFQISKEIECEAEKWVQGVIFSQVKDIEEKVSGLAPNIKQNTQKH